VGVAKPCDDASGIFYNPAALAGMSGATISAGVTAIHAFGSFTDDYSGNSWDLTSPTVPVPHVYSAFGVTPKITAGIGMFVPYGLGTRWPLDTALSSVELRQTNAFPGRFAGYDSDLRSIYIQPTLAYQINDKVSIGAGFDFVIGSVKLNQRLDLSEQVVDETTGATFANLGIPTQTDFANGHISASGATGFGGHVGVQFRPIDRLWIGARYLSRVKLDYTGTVEFSRVSTGITLPPFNPISVECEASLGALCPFPATNPLPLDIFISTLDLFSDGRPLGDTTVTLSMMMPDQVSAGIAFDVTPSFTLMADWQWVHWALFDTLTADLGNGETLQMEEHYHNTNAIRVGFEWWASNRLAIRGGYLKHQGAAPPEVVTPLLPEASRNEFTGGFGVKLSSALSADFAYQYLRQDKVRGRVVEPLSGSPTTALNSGLYEFNGHLAAATITVHF